MRRLARIGIVVGVALSACTPTANARLAKNLIATSALEKAPWNLRLASGKTLNPFGVTGTGSPIDTSDVRATGAVATRQWVPSAAPVGPGPLRNRVFSVIDRATSLSQVDATRLLADLARDYSTSTQAIPGVAGASVLAGPFRAIVAGGQLTGREDLVLVVRPRTVFTVLIVGGGSHPTDAEVQTLATLQVAAIGR